MRSGGGACMRGARARARSRHTVMAWSSPPLATARCEPLDISRCVRGLLPPLYAHTNLWQQQRAAHIVRVP